MRRNKRRMCSWKVCRAAGGWSSSRRKTCFGQDLWSILYVEQTRETMCLLQLHQKHHPRPRRQDMVDAFVCGTSVFHSCMQRQRKKWLYGRQRTRGMTRSSGRSRKRWNASCKFEVEKIGAIHFGYWKLDDTHSQVSRVSPTTISRNLSCTYKFVEVLSAFEIKRLPPVSLWTNIREIMCVSTLTGAME